MLGSEIEVSPIYRGMQLAAMKWGVPIKALTLLIMMWMLMVSFFYLILLPSLFAIVGYFILRIAYHIEPSWDRLFLTSIKAFPIFNLRIRGCETYGED